MISKTQIKKRTLRKRNPEIVETIDIAKNKNLLELARRLSGPKSRYTSINLDQLNNIKEKEIVVVGKVLGQGEITRKMEIAALGFSKQAEEKLKKAGCEIRTVKQKIEKDPELKEVRLI